MRLTPRVAKGVVVGLSGIAVVVAALGAGERSGPEAGPIRVAYIFSKDAEPVLGPLVERYNREQHVVAGRQVEIVPTAQNSGETEAALVAHATKPALWTPASSLWGGLLDREAHTGWAREQPVSLFSSPQVIAMWQPLARALGPPATIGWKDILALANAPQGWAAFGHPEFGQFRLGHTNPDISTSGLSAVASEYYAVTHKTTNLGLADIRRPAVRAAVRAIEQSIVHYGYTASDLLDKMDAYGIPYANAVYVQESQVIDFNKQRQQKTPLVAIAPAEGTFVADYPLIRLRAPWIDPTTRKAVDGFARWLPSRITAAMAREQGFHLRPPAGLRRLQFPSAAVLAAIRRNWRADRKHANVALVVDTSSTMGGAHRIDAAREALRSFVRRLTPNDRVELVSSGSKVTVLPFGRSRAAVGRAVDGLFPEGDLPVYAAVTRAIADVRALHDERSINAVVVLSDGAGESAGYRELLRSVHAQQVTEGTTVRVFTVAYGEQANAVALARIAEASGGAANEAAPSDLSDVYGRIVSYF